MEDQQSLSTIERAIISGKIQLVHLSVEVGTTPTREHVEKFAALALNHKNTPLYIHS